MGYVSKLTRLDLYLQRESNDNPGMVNLNVSEPVQQTSAVSDLPNFARRDEEDEKRSSGWQLRDRRKYEKKSTKLFEQTVY